VWDLPVNRWRAADDVLDARDFGREDGHMGRCEERVPPSWDISCKTNNSSVRYQVLAQTNLN
jgi:hypothetical protein